MFAEEAGEDYLVRTGTVHDMVEKARRELPADNIAAVKKRWKADRGMLEDSLEEINAMVEDAGEGDDDVNEDDLDDEWDELGFGSTKKMSDDELERTKKVSPARVNPRRQAQNKSRSNPLSASLPFSIRGLCRTY